MAIKKKEIQLPMIQKPLSDAEIQGEVENDQAAPGLMLSPDQISIIEYQKQQPPSSGSVLAITWGSPSHLPFQLPRGQGWVRRLACRVNPQALVEFACEILRKYAPHLLASRPE